MLVFVIVFGEEDVKEVDLAARDVDRLDSVDEGFVEPLDVIIVRRADDGGEGRLGFCEEIVCVLGSGHCSDDELTGVQGLEE